MSVLKCPTNCDHIYDFPHSIITKEREYSTNRGVYVEVIEFVICRMCSHWIDGGWCNCAGRCHGQEGGTLTYMIEPDRGRLSVGQTH